MTTSEYFSAWHKGNDFQTNGENDSWVNENAYGIMRDGTGTAENVKYINKETKKH